MSLYRIDDGAFEGGIWPAHNGLLPFIADFDQPVLLQMFPVLAPTHDHLARGHGFVGRNVGHHERRIHLVGRDILISRDQFVGDRVLYVSHCVTS